jgi:alpha-galactosidase
VRCSLDRRAELRGSWFRETHGGPAPPAKRPFDDDPAYADTEGHGGAAVGALEGDGAVLLLGALGLGGRVAVSGNGLDATSATTDEWFVAYGNEREVVDRYAAQLGDRLGRRPTRDLRVWCSWYSFYRTITEPALHAVVDELDGLALGPSRLAAP